MSKSKGRSPKELEILYAKRDADVAELSRKEQIGEADLAHLDHLGKCRIANDHWRLCDDSARRSLLNDAHHFVRSCAALAE